LPAIETKKFTYNFKYEQARGLRVALEMKMGCEECDRALREDEEAYIYSYECTFCADCTTQMKQICPKCARELVRRPRRKGSPSSV
jgi:uncharacterized protein